MTPNRTSMRHHHPKTFKLKRYFIVGLALLVVACKTQPTGEAATVEKDSAAAETDAGDDQSGFAHRGLPTPVSTANLHDGNPLYGEDVADWIANPVQGAAYAYLGSLPTHWASGRSATLIEERVGSRRMIYLVCKDGAGTMAIFTTLVHHEEGSNVFIRSVIADPVAGTINRFDFRSGNKIEVHSTYDFEEAPGADFILPLLETPSGTTSDKAEMIEIIEYFQMDGEWEPIAMEKEDVWGLTYWMREPCGVHEWVGISCHGDSARIDFEEYTNAGVFPILTFSYQDTYDWEIKSLTWSDYGNLIDLEAEQINGPFSGEGDPEVKTYSYRFAPEAGLRVLDVSYGYALSSQADSLLARSPVECEDDEY